RGPGDPGGWVRERVGAGGVVGLAPALTGAPSALAWHTAGTTLLAIPPSSVAGAVGPVPGPPPAQRAELEALFDHAPALAGLSTEDGLGLMAAARPVSLPPGALLNLSGAQDAAVVASGVLVRGDGMELRAGALVGPFGVPPAGPVGAARTPVRAWVLPAFGGLPVLLRSSAPPVPGTGPAFGVHPRPGTRRWPHRPARHRPQWTRRRTGSSSGNCGGCSSCCCSSRSCSPEATCCPARRGARCRTTVRCCTSTRARRP